MASRSNPSPSASSSSSGGWDPFGPSTVAVVLLSVLVVQNVWSSAPRWLKSRITLGLAGGGGGGGGGSSNDKETSNRDDDEHAKGKDVNDDLTNPANLYEKVSQLNQLARDLCDGQEDTDITTTADTQRWDTMPWYKYYCCFMSLLHLQQELETTHPEFRNELYGWQGDDALMTKMEASSSSSSSATTEVETLLLYLDFAHWAYLNDTTELHHQLKTGRCRTGQCYELIRHDRTTEPGRVGHYMAVHHETKQVILAIKGTNTLGDVLTDILGRAIPHTISSTGTTGTTTTTTKEIRCHEGMYTAAQMMLNDTLHLLQHWVEPAGYSLIVCGHSLGAAVSCLLGILIQQQLPTLKLHVYAYATPACLSYEASVQSQDFITSVVNNNDIVPRLSLLNLRLLNRLFVLIDTKLTERGLSPDDFTSATKYLKDLLTVNNDLLLQPEEIMAFFQHHLVDQAEHQVGQVNEKLLDIELFVPGRVVSIWNMDQLPQEAPVPQDSMSDAKNPTITTTTSESEESTTPRLQQQQQQVGARVLHGGMVVLRTIMVTLDMVSDHHCNKYRNNLQTLLLQQRQPSSVSPTPTVEYN
jgi:hypothetical protein